MNFKKFKTIKDPPTNWSMLQNELKVQGFIVSTFKKDWPQAFTEMNEYIKQVNLVLIFKLKILKLSFIIIVVKG